MIERGRLWLRDHPDRLLLFMAIGLGAYLCLGRSLLPRTLATGLIVLPPLLSIRRAEFRLLARQPIVLAAAALLAWLCLSLAWSPYPRFALWPGRLEYAASSLSLVLALGVLALRLDNPAGRLFLGLVPVAGAVVVASIVAFYATSPFPERLHFIGGAVSPSVGGAVQASILVGALALARPAGRQHLWFWPSLALVLLGVVLTQGRGPFLAVLAAGLVLLAARRRWAWLAGLAVLGLAGIAVLAVLAPEIVFRVSADIRIEIWRGFLAHVLARPWLGHGYGDLTRVVVTMVGETRAYGPHSLFLGVAFHGGLVGLALFLGLLGSALATAWRQRPEAAALVAFVAVNGAVDFSHIVEPLGPTWFVLWLPLAAVLAAALNRSARPGTRGGTAGDAGRPPPDPAYPPPRSP